MTSKERVRAVMQRKKPDRIPAAFEAVGKVTEKLLKHYGFQSFDELLAHYDIDIVPVSPRYIGPKLDQWKNDQGQQVEKSYWGYETTIYETDLDCYGVTTYFPFNLDTTVEEIEQYPWPQPDWFDYSVLKDQIQRHPDKAIIIGHEGPFQIVTYLINMEDFFIMMYEDPDKAMLILNKMIEFELAYYQRCFEAAEGQIDVLRTHDDYGTQISLLFSVDMWQEFYAENTKKLVNLAHQYGAYFQQHSCGAVEPIIGELIACNVDALEPIQKVEGMEVDHLVTKYGGKITFHGGIDTQDLLPHGTAQEVKREVDYFIKTLGRTNGYILMASQAFEMDVPVENIEAIYTANRTL